MSREPSLPSDASDADAVRERRIGLLLLRLPERLRRAVAWLRRPQARWVRIPIGVLLILGSLLSLLPVFGLWMLPLGVVLLAEDVKSLQRLVDRGLSWIERRRPHWMGLHRIGSDGPATLDADLDRDHAR